MPSSSPWDITTNLDYPDWYGLFQRKSLVDAFLDRLKHHCITIRIDGSSLREWLPMKKKKPRANPDPVSPSTIPSCP
jgi:DNA replication protein DnaC